MELMKNPDGFFTKLKQEEVRIRKPLIIVVLLAMLVSSYQYLLISKLSQAFPQEIAKFLIIGAYIGIVGSFIGLFAVWLISAVVMHGISALFGGEGCFRRTFEFTGYGFLPSLIGSLITVSMSAYYISQAEVPQLGIAQIQNPDVMKLLMLSIIPKDLIYSNLIISVSVTPWSQTIWTFAIKHARRLTTKKAFASALIPTVIFGLYQIYSVVKLL